MSKDYSNQVKIKFAVASSYKGDSSKEQRGKICDFIWDLFVDEIKTKIVSSNSFVQCSLLDEYGIKLTAYSIIPQLQLQMQQVLDEGVSSIRLDKFLPNE